MTFEDARTGAVQGSADPQFRSLADAFAASFELPGDAGEHGAQLAVFHRGRLVADLWGGFEDAARTVPLRRNALICTFSAIKAPAALCALVLAEDGAIDPFAPIADRWPGFAANGKSQVTLADVLSHRSGLWMVTDGAAPGYSHDAWRDALERAPLRHKPGAERWYHAVTLGFIVAEMVARAAGRPFRSVFADRLATPLGCDLHVGLPQAALARAAPVLPPCAPPIERDPWAAEVIGQLSPDPGMFNDPAFRTAVIPAASGFCTALGLARLYAALAGDGTLDGVRIAAPETVRLLASERWDAPVAPRGYRWRVGLGAHLSTDFSYFGPGSRAFGHAGAGGATGFADPDAALAFAYMPVRIAPGAGSGPRSRALVDATMQCLRMA